MDGKTGPGLSVVLEDGFGGRRPPRSCSVLAAEKQAGTPLSRADGIVAAFEKVPRVEFTEVLR